MSERYYFAYGSNLNIFQMMKRVGEWKTAKRAHLEGYKLVFNVKSPRWGGMAADIQKTGNSQDIVYGVVYLINDEKLAVMTTYERIPPEFLDVKLEDEIMLNAAVYIFGKNRPSENPPAAYKNTILEGLMQHGYPTEIIEKIKESFQT